MAKFYLGRLVSTSTVADLMREQPKFSKFVSISLKRYVEGDWGDLCEDDKAMNDHAVKTGNERIMGAYTIEGHDDWRIWIITEWDHSRTTVLFPSEY